MRTISNVFEEITSIDNLILAYRRAQKGKRYHDYVSVFDYHATSNLLKIQRDLRHGTYQLAPYRYFVLRESKSRSIAAPGFRDRIVQHAICVQLYPFYERLFIPDSYACRPDKGTHRAMRRVQHYLRVTPPTEQMYYMPVRLMFRNITLQ
ncbi:MAG: hypothetical protein WAW80_00790 [Candidatus Saccharimonadales bacterium]